MDIPQLFNLIHIHPALSHNVLAIKEKGLLEIEEPLSSSGKIPSCTTYGIRTRDSSVKGRRLNPLTNAAFRLGLQR